MSTFRSEARVPTSRSARYLGQLCKHFAHKIPASYSDARGKIEFPSGVCELEASNNLLVLRAAAADAAALSQVEDVVARHLERFAFREQAEFRWTRGAA